MITCIILANDNALKGINNDENAHSDITLIGSILVKNLDGVFTISNGDVDRGNDRETCRSLKRDGDDG